MRHTVIREGFKGMANPQKIKARIIEITTHGDGVYSVLFESERRLPRFKPGQFLHLSLDEFDPSTGYWPESRVFSIAIAPTQNTLAIAYSVKGAYTGRMEKELFVGKSVWLKSPYGSFIIDELVEENAPAVLVAGGTGFTPFVSFLDREAETKSYRAVTLFYGIRKPSLLLFESILDRTSKVCEAFTLKLMIEESAADAPLPAKTGRLNPDHIIEAHKNLNGASIFLAGPPLMMDSFKKSFLAAGVASDKIIIDEWE